MTKKIIYVDMDDTLCNYSTAYSNALASCPEIAYPQSQYGFFAKLQEIEGAVDAYRKLSQQNNFDVYILTAPSFYNPTSYTEKRLWVEQHMGFDYVKDLIICHNKSLLIGDYLIDDCESGNGQEKFSGEHLHFGSSSFANWQQCLNYLIKN